MRCLIIDDERDLDQVAKQMHSLYGISLPTNAIFSTCKDYGTGILALQEPYGWDILYLDHDLASFDSDGQETTGYHVMCFLEENQQFLPKEIYTISASPVGRQRINQVINKLYKL